MIHQNVQIPIEQGLLQGELFIPQNALGIVLFAHGSGSSRFSPRNQFVAQYLQKHLLGTFLLDLLTLEEEKIDDYTKEYRFNIELLADRLLKATNWIKQNFQVHSLPIGYFGSSTGAAAALIAAAKLGSEVSVVVSRGGRPDLAESFLPQVTASTLLIVGGHDFIVIELNQQALKQLKSEKKLEIVPDATHLFEEPGALEKVAQLASDWFSLSFHSI